MSIDVYSDIISLINHINLGISQTKVWKILKYFVLFLALQKCLITQVNGLRPKEKKLDLIERLAFGDPAHYVLDWPNQNKTTEMMGPTGLELKIGNQVLHQLVTVDMLHLIMDNIRGVKLPFDNIPFELPVRYDPDSDMSRNPSRSWFNPADYFEKKFGRVVLELFNIRMHYGKITESFHSWKKIKKNLSFKPSIDEDQILMRVEDDHISVDIRGLSLEVTSEFTIQGISGYAHDINFHRKGAIWMRVLDMAISMKLDLVQDEHLGHPTVNIRPSPKVSWSKLQVRMDRTYQSDIISAITQILAKKFKKSISRAVSQVFITHIPLLNDVVGSLINDAIQTNLNSLLARWGLPASDVPELIVEDLRWRVYNHRISISTNLLYVDRKIRAEIEEKLGHAKRRAEELSSEEWKEQRELVLDVLKRWRPVSASRNILDIERLLRVGITSNSGLA